MRMMWWQGLQWETTWAEPLISTSSLALTPSRVTWISNSVNISVTIYRWNLLKILTPSFCHFKVSLLYSDILYNHFYLIATYCTCSTLRVLSFWMSCICVWGRGGKPWQLQQKNFKALPSNLSSLPQKDCLYTVAEKTRHLEGKGEINLQTQNIYNAAFLYTCRGLCRSSARSPIQMHFLKSNKTALILCELS